MTTRENDGEQPVRSDWFEEVWRHRDEDIYPQIIGRSSDGLVFRIPYVAFSQIGADRVDPRWLHCGILRFGPTRDRDGFVFLTSGLSNPWDDDYPDADGVSGLGIELRLDNPTDDHWCKDVMLRISALQLLINAGRMSGRLFEDGDVAIVGQQTFEGSMTMTALLFSAIESVLLISGTFRILQLFAITQAEQEYASERGADALLTLLKQKTSYPMNDLNRASVV